MNNALNSADFSKYISCAFHQCIMDDFLTMFSFNDEFLKLSGFSGDEVKNNFKNRYMEMIHPLDREKIRALINRENKVGEVKEAEYRIIDKNGAIKWILDRYTVLEENNRKFYNSVMMDITGHKRTTEDLKLSLERLEIIMNHTSDIIFEWDIESDRIQYSSNFEETFGYMPVLADFSTAFNRENHVHNEDAEKLKNLIIKVRQGIVSESMEIRIRKADGDYLWCRIWVTDQYKESGRPTRAIGVITDIDKEKKLIETLKRRAERDALTGLYNREETETLIDRFLSERSGSGKAALSIIDIDNFKLANDTNGHLFGDAVLSEISAALRKAADEGDIIGRIGGDEFAVFFQHVAHEKDAEQRTEKLLKEFHSLFSQEKHKYSLACSIGVSIYPEHGHNFKTLYDNADTALYNAKCKGKNRVVMYNGGEKEFRNKLSASGGNETISFNAFEDTRIPGYVLQILYNATDVEKAVELIMEIVGSRYDVSRSYIFENSYDGDYSSNTFEWCNDGIKPEKANLQHISYQELENYKQHFDDNGIFYCRNVDSLPPSQAHLLKSQGIKSVLQCAIKENGRFVGFVGFDECTGRRLWTNEEIKMLTFVSQLLSTFLYKKRALDRFAASESKLNSILDNMDSYIYAIDSANYRLLYFNRKTKLLDPTVKDGDCCYKAFFLRDTPCKHCPVKNLQKGRAGGEFYNPKYDLWTMAAACAIDWDDKKAYLIACHNIDIYKKHDEDNETGDKEKERRKVEKHR